MNASSLLYLRKISEDRFIPKGEWACKPSSVVDNNLSSRRVATPIQPRFWRSERAAHMISLGVAPDRVYMAFESPQSR